MSVIFEAPQDVVYTPRHGPHLFIPTKRAGEGQVQVHHLIGDLNESAVEFSDYCVVRADAVNVAGTAQEDGLSFRNV